MSTLPRTPEEEKAYRASLKGEHLIESFPDDDVAAPPLMVSIQLTPEQIAQAAARVTSQ